MDKLKTTEGVLYILKSKIRMHISKLCWSWCDLNCGYLLGDIADMSDQHNLMWGMDFHFQVGSHENITIIRKIKYM